MFTRRANSPNSPKFTCLAGSLIPWKIRSARLPGLPRPEDIGRAGLRDEFEYGLQLGSGAPGLLSIFTGALGIGKTVMLAAAH